MKFIYIFLLIKTSLFCQDSLYWFNFNLLKNKIPKTAKVLDQVFEETQFLILDTIVNNSQNISDGFRLQIYDALSVDNINLALKRYRKKLPDSLYIVFEAPFYKIQYGNFNSKKEAEIEKKDLIKKGFQDIWIVKSRINK